MYQARQAKQLSLDENLMNDKIRKQIEEYSKSLKWTPQNFYWNHALLVRKFALIIQEKIRCDKDIVETSALLHDIGKSKLLAPGHEKISAQLARELLKKIGFNENMISKIVSVSDMKILEVLRRKFCALLIV